MAYLVNLSSITRIHVRSSTWRHSVHVAVCVAVRAAMHVAVRVVVRVAVRVAVHVYITPVLRKISEHCWPVC